MSKAITPIGIIGIFYCSKCGNSFERTLYPTVKKHRTGTVSLTITFYPKEVFCNECHKEMYDAEQRATEESKKAYYDAVAKANKVPAPTICTKTGKHHPFIEDPVAIGMKNKYSTDGSQIILASFCKDCGDQIG